MNTGKACAIFKQLESENFTNEEKAIAIHAVMNMPTHMSIKKDDMIIAIKWLWNQRYEITPEEELQ